MYRMLLALLCAMAATAAAAATIPLPATGRHLAASPVLQATCVGDRSSYRSFNHCWNVVSKRARVDAASRYCSRICR